MEDADEAERRAASVGLVTTAALAVAGGSASTFRRRSRPDGPWQRLGPNVAAPHAGPVLQEQRLAAALHRCPSARATGALACRLFGLSEEDTAGPAAIVVPQHLRMARRPQLVVLRRRRPGELLHLTSGGASWPVARPLEAVADGVRLALDERAGRALAGAALRSGLVDPLELAAALSVGRHRKSLGAVLDELSADGAWSPPEGDVLALVRRSAMLPEPEPELNVAVADVATGRVVARPDGLLWAVATGWQVDSRVHHAEDDDWARSLGVGVACERRGLRVLHVAPATCEADPAGVVEALETLAADRLAAGPPAGLVRLPGLAPPGRTSLWRPDE